MVRITAPTWSIAAAASCAVLHHANAAPQPMSLQLHRLPTPTVRADTYQRRRLIEADANEVVPLNLGMGTHYAWVYVGTPPQRASVITDTGSSIMAFPCSECANCGKHTDQPFAAANSSTLTHVTCSTSSHFRCQSCLNDDVCQISQSYMEGSSWHATVVDDIVYLGGEASGSDTVMRDQFGTRFMFGCQNRETGLFITQVADGIMGLANNDHHIVAKLHKEEKIPEKVFALCFGAEGGSMSIGAPHTAVHKGNVSYAKVIKTISHDFYGVQLKDVRIGGASIEAPESSFLHGQYIVDSGTTDSYLPSSMKSAFQAAFKRASGLDYQVSSSSCHGYTDEDLKKLPNIEVVLGAEDGGNMSIIVTPDQYLLQEESGKYCASVFLSESSGGVIGANMMIDRDVIFDQGKQRVGFVDADCTYRELSAKSNTTTSPTTNGTTNSTTMTETVKPTSVPTTQPPATPAPTTSTPAPTTSSPTAAPETKAPVPTTMAPAPTETKPPQQTEVPAPTKDAAIPESEDLNVAKATDVPQTTAPTPTTKSGKHTSSTTHSGTQKTESDGDHPLVLTIVGTILAVLFLLVIAASIKRHKKKQKDHSWKRVNEAEGDEDDDDDDDEEELMSGADETKKRAASKHHGRRRSDDLGSDDSDDDVHRGGRLADDDDDYDDDDDDEIFDDIERGQDEHKHDTRVLERL